MSSFYNTLDDNFFICVHATYFVSRKICFESDLTHYVFFHQWMLLGACAMRIIICDTSKCTSIDFFFKILFGNISSERSLKMFFQLRNFFKEGVSRALLIFSISKQKKFVSLSSSQCNIHLFINDEKLVNITTFIF